MDPCLLESTFTPNKSDFFKIYSVIKQVSSKATQAGMRGKWSMWAWLAGRAALKLPLPPSTPQAAVVVVEEDSTTVRPTW